MTKLTPERLKEIREKVCSRCKTRKPLEDFAKDKRKLYGCSYVCQVCMREYRREQKRRRRSEPKSAQIERETWRRYQDKHRLRLSEMRKRRYQRDRDKYLAYAKERQHTPEVRARIKLQTAVKSGRISKPTCCEECGRRVSNSKFLHAHHKDYSRPYDVEWLCSRCHGKRHRIEVSLEDSA